MFLFLDKKKTKHDVKILLVIDKKMHHVLHHNILHFPLDTPFASFWSHLQDRNNAPTPQRPAVGTIGTIFEGSAAPAGLHPMRVMRESIGNLWEYMGIIWVYLLLTNGNYMKHCKSWDYHATDHQPVQDYATLHRS